MIRKQIYISKPTDEQLSRIAQVQGKTIAEIVRTFIEEGIKRTDDVDYSGASALLKLASLRVKGGPNDLSTNIDHYLYGGTKKN